MPESLRLAAVGLLALVLVGCSVTLPQVPPPARPECARISTETLIGAVLMVRWCEQSTAGKGS